jgi:hypothetical protein
MYGCEIPADDGVDRRDVRLSVGEDGQGDSAVRTNGDRDLARSKEFESIGMVDSQSSVPIVRQGYLGSFGGGGCGNLDATTRGSGPAQRGCPRGVAWYRHVLPPRPGSATGDGSVQECIGGRASEGGGVSPRALGLIQNEPEPRSTRCPRCWKAHGLVKAPMSGSFLTGQLPAPSQGAWRRCFRPGRWTRHHELALDSYDRLFRIRTRCPGAASTI